MAARMGPPPFSGPCAARPARPREPLMIGTWQEAFTRIRDFTWKDGLVPAAPISLGSLDALKSYLEWVHVKYCLVRPFFEHPDYPTVEPRELLPSFEMDAYEYANLPGFSMVALDRPLDYFQEVFQFDFLHSPLEFHNRGYSEVCPLECTVQDENVQTMRERLPRKLQQEFRDRFHSRDICCMEAYPEILPFLLQMDRAHVMALDGNREFQLQGVYASLPSDLDAELKRFGMKIGKFKPGDTPRYERNRLFVYQFLMELYGFPIASERRTSAALFARRLFKMGERFMIKVLGQSDRTITTLWSHPEHTAYPRLEKTALVSVHADQAEAVALLRQNGYFLDEKRRVVIIRVIYEQHRFNPENVREDRALSVTRQEVIHPLTGVPLQHLNIIKDATSMILRLNDIVRGEYKGTIVYRRHEIVQDTDTHEKRLKFLSTWLSKHQRRIIGYSDEFYANVVKIMDSYLLDPRNYEVFKPQQDLHREVWAKFSYIQQARKVRIIEDLGSRTHRGERVSYERALKLMVEVLGDLKFEVVNYFDKFVESVLIIGEKMLADPYLVRSYANRPDEALTPYGLKVKKYYGRLVAVLDEFRAIRRMRRDAPPAPSAGAS